MALDLEKRVRHSDPRVRQVVSADYGDMHSESAIATSTGIAGTHAAHHVQPVGLCDRRRRSTDRHTGVGFGFGRRPSAMDPEQIAEDAIERATRLIGAKKIPSSYCTVVLDRRVTSTLLAVVSGALSGEAVVKNRSMFVGRLGEAGCGS